MVLHSDGLSSKKMRCEDFELKTVISRGTFGVVYRAIRKEDGKEFALKQVSLAGLGRAEREECIDEARILSQLNHPHIVRHYDSFVDTKEQKLNIFMEYAAGGTIHHLLAKRGKRIDESDCWRYFLQCLLALDHIHSKKIIHRDMKSLNVFLDSNNDVKIGDFGIARSLSNNSNFARTIVGTPFYLSPELCDDKPYNEKSDIWALGVILYECCTGQQPFTAQNEGALIRKILRGKFPPPIGCSIELVQTINKCLCYDHARRPTAGQLLAWSGIRSTARRLGLDIDINKKLHLLKRTPTPTPLPPVVHSPKKAVSKQSPEPEIPPALEHVNEENESKRINQNVEGLEGKKGVAPREPHIFDLDCAEESFRRNVYGERPTTTPPDNLGGIPSQLQRPPTPANLNKEDHISELMKGYNGCKLEELRTGIQPEQLPAAGVQLHRDKKGLLISSGKLEDNYRTMSQEQGRKVWSAKYEAPRYARRRCPELQATGPIFRGERGGGRPGGNSPRNNRTAGARLQPIDTTSTSYERSCAPTMMTRGEGS